MILRKLRFLFGLRSAEPLLVQLLQLVLYRQLGHDGLDSMLMPPVVRTGRLQRHFGI